MLVLTRKHQERIRIGDNVVLTVLRIKGNTVRIGIEAPREVRVIRGELPPKDDMPLEPMLAMTNEDSSEGEHTESAPAEATPAATEEQVAEADALRQLVRRRRRRRQALAVANAL